MKKFKLSHVLLTLMALVLCACMAVPAFASEAEGDETPEPPATCDHDWSETITKEANCTETGTKTKTCTLCGATEEEIIDALGHSVPGGRAAWTTITPATCVPGTKAKLCTVCGETLEEGTIPATGEHNFVDTATCTAGGIMTCTGCGETTGEPTPALGHSPRLFGGRVKSEWNIIRPATCMSEGIQVKECDRCNKELDRETIPVDPNAHKWEIRGISDDCYYHFEVCRYNEEHTQETPHVAIHYTETKATCTTAGGRVGTCYVCGKPVDWVFPIDPDAHDWTYGWNEDVHFQVCKNDPTHIRNVEPHTRDRLVVTPATCTTAGTAWIGECLGCLYLMEDETIPATGHDWGEITDHGDTHSAVCKNDPEHTLNEVPHSCTNWTVTTPATATEAGEEVGTCDVCGHPMTRAIDPLGDKDKDDNKGNQGDDDKQPETPVTPPSGNGNENRPNPGVVTPPSGGGENNAPVTPAETEVIDGPDVPLAEAPAEELEVIEDADVPLAEAPTDGTEVIEDADVPLAELPEELAQAPAQAPAEELEVIEDGAVPLSDVPQTGEASTALWLAAVLIAGMGLVYVNTGKRRQNAR